MVNFVLGNQKNYVGYCIQQFNVTFNFAAHRDATTFAASAPLQAAAAHHCIALWHLGGQMDISSTLELICVFYPS